MSKKLTEEQKRDVLGMKRILSQLWNENVKTIEIPLETEEKGKMMLKIELKGLYKNKTKQRKC